jgi:DNA-binding beta-propeller fold protein YncE
MHGLAYDATHDEVVVPVALGAAVLTFRGGATGEEPPIRSIQGPHTHLVRPHTLAVDEKNGEIIVADTSSRSLLVFSRDADGDVPPKRIIAGSKTGLLFIVGVAVDPVHDRIVAASASSVRGGTTGLFIFGRSDNGDIAPLGVIAGPRTGLVRPWQLAIDPAQGNVFVAAINNENHPPYALEMPRRDLPPDTDLPSPWNTGAPGFCRQDGARLVNDGTHGKNCNPSNRLSEAPSSWCNCFSGSGCADRSFWSNTCPGTRSLTH